MLRYGNWSIGPAEVLNYIFKNRRDWQIDFYRTDYLFRILRGWKEFRYIHQYGISVERDGRPIFERDIVKELRYAQPPQQQPKKESLWLWLFRWLGV